MPSDILVFAGRCGVGRNGRTVYAKVCSAWKPHRTRGTEPCRRVATWCSGTYGAPGTRYYCDECRTATAKPITDAMLRGTYGRAPTPHPDAAARPGEG